MTCRGSGVRVPYRPPNKVVDFDRKSTTFFLCKNPKKVKASRVLGFALYRFRSVSEAVFFRFRSILPRRFFGRVCFMGVGFALWVWGLLYPHNVNPWGEACLFEKPSSRTKIGTTEILRLPRFFTCYFSVFVQNRQSMVAASAREASPPGTSLPSLPLMMPFITHQCMASSAQLEIAEASG